MIRRITTLLAGFGLVCAMLATPTAPAVAQEKKLVAAIPGIPPIFSVMIVYVAEKHGFFKKHGVDVQIRPFDNGTAAARAVVSRRRRFRLVADAAGDQPDLQCRRAPGRALWHAEPGLGHRHHRNRQDLQGHQGPGSRRRLGWRRALGGAALDADRLRRRKIEDTKQVGLGGGTGSAMIAGKLQYGVLHLDDIAAIEEQGKKLTILMRLKDTDPTSHYLMMIARKDKLAANRDAFVRATAAMIEAARYMADPKNVDTVAEDCTITGNSRRFPKARSSSSWRSISGR